MALPGHQSERLDQPLAHGQGSRYGLSRILSPAFGWRFSTETKTPPRTDRFWQNLQPEAIKGNAEIAQSMYRGIFEFADETVLTTPNQLFQPGTGGREWTNALLRLDWLLHFSVQPKKLGACFAATLMQSWNNMSARRQGIEPEAQRLLNMQACFPVLAQRLEVPQIQILMQSLRIQCARLKQARPRNMAEASHQALTLALADLAMQHPGENLGESLRRLDATLAKTIHADGGPVATDVATHMRLQLDLSQLEKAMWQRHMVLSPASTQVRDRIATFLAMFQRSDGSPAFNLQHLPAEGQNQIQPCDIQRVAARSGIVRLCHGRTVLIASHGSGFDGPCVDISVGKSPLFYFAARQTADHTGDVALVEDNQGSILESQRRQIFLASSGDDIRIQQQSNANSTGEPLLLNFNPNIRISLARHSGRVSLALPDRTHWQLSIRGGRFQPGNNSHQLLLVPETGTGKTLNWAIKRMVGEATGRSAKSENKSSPPPELLL